MKFWPTILLFSTALISANAATQYPVQYEGGSLPMSHNKVTARVSGGEVIFVQHGQQFSVPVANITAISCGSDVHKRFGFVPLVRFGTTETAYIGVTWTDSARHEVLFKLNGREYRDFLNALEASTGKKAVDAHKVPSVVDYSL
ncbi:MAG TPA: hypothetical protein VGH38_24425 [Bryobacteraceae bacterium]|jgi:hypothetical protein